MDNRAALQDIYSEVDEISIPPKEEELDIDKLIKEAKNEVKGIPSTVVTKPPNKIANFLRSVADLME